MNGPNHYVRISVSNRSLGPKRCSFHHCVRTTIGPTFKYVSVTCTDWCDVSVYHKCIKNKRSRLLKQDDFQTYTGTTFLSQLENRVSLWCNLSFILIIHKFFKKITKYSNGQNTGLTIVFNYLYFCLHCVIPWWLLIYTISFRIPVYINLSSQNLHSAIAALKREAKPLTTLNIKV